MPLAKLARPHFLLTARNFSLPLGTKTRIMGIVNITPDSFSQDGLIFKKSNGHKVTRSQMKILKTDDFTARAIQRAKKMAEQGADIIDIGGESTRPGSKRICAKEEEARIIPAIAHLAKTLNVPIAADTYKTHVAQAALDAGASLINNIKGVRAERSLLKMVARYDAAIVLMHIQGTPRTMQKKIFYSGDIVEEIISALQNSMEKCLEIGIKSDKIIVDPGIGFGKTVEQNLQILNRLNEFQQLKAPLLIGTSRKSFIGAILGREVKERLLGTLATTTAGILNGAHMVRVHDVAAAREAALMTDAILNQGCV